MSLLACRRGAIPGLSIATLVLAAGAASAATPASRLPRDPDAACTILQGLKLPGTTITLAQPIHPAPEYVVPGTESAAGGPVLNPSGAIHQVQGSVIDGLSTMAALEITLAAGHVTQRNFGDYPPLRMPDAPLVDVHFIEPDYPPTGTGEPALPPLAPAVAHALFAATEPDWDAPPGQRLDPGAVDAMPLAGEVHHRLGPKMAQKFDLLLLPPAAVVEVFVQRVVLDVVPACADAQPQPPTRKDVDFRGLLCNQCRLALRKDDDSGDKLDTLRHSGEVAEQHERLVKTGFVCVRPGQPRFALRNRPEHVIVDEQVRIAERLDGLGEISDDRRIAADFGLWKDNACLHCAWLLRWWFRV
jgi:hypothetical protein